MLLRHESNEVTNDQDATGKCMMDWLSDDMVVEVCSFLDVYSLLSMVKALRLVKGYQPLVKRLARVSVTFDPRRDGTLHAEVLANLKCITWYLGSRFMDYGEYLSHKYPGYHFAYTVDGLAILDELPSATTELRVYSRNEPITSFSRPGMRWPCQLRKLVISGKFGPLHLSPPESLQFLAVRDTEGSGEVIINGPIPNLTTLSLGVHSFEITGDEPLAVKKLKLWRTGHSIPDGLLKLILRCTALTHLSTDYMGLECPSTVQELHLLTETVPNDDRVTWLTLAVPCEIKLPALTVLTVELFDLINLVVPATVTRLTLISRALEVRNTLHGKRITNVPGINTLTLIKKGLYEDQLHIPSLKKWAALESITIDGFDMHCPCIDAPKVSSVVLTECSLQDIHFDCDHLQFVTFSRCELMSSLALPDTVESLDLADSIFRSKTVFVYAQSLSRLNATSLGNVQVYYNSTRLEFAGAHWQDLRYFGPMEGNSISQFPRYELANQDFSCPRYGDWHFPEDTMYIRRKINKERSVILPPATTFAHFSFLGVPRVAFSQLWSQVPDLRYLKIEFSSLIETLCLPLLVKYLSLYLPHSLIESCFEVTFDSYPTALEWLYIGCSDLGTPETGTRWLDLDSIGGCALHPNLRFINSKPVNI